MTRPTRLTWEPWAGDGVIVVSDSGEFRDALETAHEGTTVVIQGSDDPEHPAEFDLQYRMGNWVNVTVDDEWTVGGIDVTFHGNLPAIDGHGLEPGLPSRCMKCFLNGECVEGPRWAEALRRRA